MIIGRKETKEKIEIPWKMLLHMADSNPAFCFLKKQNAIIKLMT